MRQYRTPIVCSAHMGVINEHGDPTNPCKQSETSAAIAVVVDGVNASEELLDTCGASGGPLSKSVHFFERENLRNFHVDCW